MKTQILEFEKSTKRKYALMSELLQTYVNTRSSKMLKKLDLFDKLNEKQRDVLNAIDAQTNTEIRLEQTNVLIEHYMRKFNTTSENVAFLFDTVHNEAKKLNRIEAQITKNSNEAELVRILEIAKKQLEAIKSVSK